MLLNNSAGIDVIPVLAKVPLNIESVRVAELVLMVLNNSAGISVIPVQPENVPENIPAAPLLIPLNSPAGIDVNDVQPEKVPENIEGPATVIPLNKSSGISVNDVQPENVEENISCLAYPKNSAPNEPDIDATFVFVVPENDIAEG